MLKPPMRHHFLNACCFPLPLDLPPGGVVQVETRVESAWFQRLKLNLRERRFRVYEGAPGFRPGPRERETLPRV